MFINSPRAVRFTKLVLQLCIDLAIYVIIAGVIIELEIINIIGEMNMKKIVFKTLIKARKVSII
jgi:hypothetical protein